MSTILIIRCYLDNREAANFLHSQSGSVLWIIGIQPMNRQYSEKSESLTYIWSQEWICLGSVVFVDQQHSPQYSDCCSLTKEEGCGKCRWQKARKVDD